MKANYFLTAFCLFFLISATSATLLATTAPFLAWSNGNMLTSMVPWNAIQSYFGNNYNYLMWLVSDAACLTIGWVGVLLF